MPNDSFTLRVTFTGLGVHVIHPKVDQVAVLLPDARFRTSGWDAWSTHPDGTQGIPHAGFLRVDLANLAPGAGVPRGQVNADGEGGPEWEVLYQLNRDTLDFGFPAATGPRRGHEPKMNVPNADDYAPTLELIDGVLDQTPTAEKLLFRTVLQGGTFHPSKPKETWRLAGTLIETGRRAIDFPLSGYTNWSRKVDGESVTLTLRHFDGTPRLALPLYPVDGVVDLRISNLCAENPLEWDALKTRKSPSEDVDFKWHYHLLQPADSRDWSDLLAGAMLPAPRFLDALFTGDPDDCGHTKISASFNIVPYATSAA